MNILITGCSRGIGRGFLEQYLADKEVKKVYAVTTSPDQLKSIQSEVKDRLQILPISVSKPESVEKLKAALKDASIDLLINCAGTYPEESGGFPALKMEGLDEGMHVNTYSVIYTLQGSLAALKRAKNPRVASMTSLMGSIADNTSGGSYSYRMSKAALNMFNKCFSIEFKEFVSVVFHPGWVQTEMGGKQAPTTIDESVSGMMKKIKTLKPSDNGKFYDYEGDSVEW